MGGREEIRTVAAWAIAGALLVGCSSDSARGKGTDQPRGPRDGGGGAGGIDSPGGKAGGQQAGSTGRGNGGHSGAGAPSSGGVGPDGGNTGPDSGATGSGSGGKGPVPAAGACVAKKDLPANCSDVCLDQGKICSEDCDFGTVLPGRAAYYSDLSACQDGAGPTFVETAKCDSPFDKGDFLPYAAVRCCCTVSDFAVASSAEKQPLCETACAKDPYPPVPECSTDGSCGDRCLNETRGLDIACARCLIEQVSFTPSGCGTWECVCGGASFSSSSSACASECAASKQHEKDVYAAKPRPAPVGTPPAARFDVENSFAIAALQVDAQGRLWVSGHSNDASGTRVASVALFDADLHQLWKWDDPGKRQSDGGVPITIHGGEAVVALSDAGTTELVFFDGTGHLRESTANAQSPQAIASFGDALLVKHGSVSMLTVFETDGKERVTASTASFDGLPGRWVHAAGAGAFTLVDDAEDGIQWRRVTVSTSATAVAWTRHVVVAPPTRGISFAGAGPGAGNEVLAWGGRYEPRNGLDDGYPFVCHLADDGTVPWQWSNGNLVTRGTIAEAVMTAGGRTCAVSTESWEFSQTDAPASGPRCSPDGCNALTVRCLDASAKEVFRYHHRSELSAGNAIAADGTGRLFVAATFTRLYTGTRGSILRFDP